MTKRKIVSRYQLTDEQIAKQYAAINAWRLGNAKNKGALIDEDNYVIPPENSQQLISEERARKIVDAVIQQELQAAKVEQIRLKRIAYLQSIGQAVEE